MHDIYDITPKAHVKHPKKAKAGPRQWLRSVLIATYAALVTFITLAGITGWVCIALAAIKYLFS